jgi:hypothetical protein
MPFYPKVLQAKECTPIPFPFTVFIFGLVVKSIKQLGGVSLTKEKETKKKVVIY